MADLIGLKSGRFKGVDFLFTDMTTTGGNRIIKYNYPGSDKQKIERQGKMPRSYSLTIWIPHENYFEDRDSLLRVLEDGESGTLTHPTFGEVNNVTNGSYRLSEQITSLGRGSIQVTFERDNAQGVPVQSGDLSSQVQALSDATTAAAFDDLAGGYEVSTSLAGSFSDALENAGQAVSAIGSASEAALSSTTEELAVFRAKLQTVTGKIGDLIQAPADLATEISGLFADLNNVLASPGDALAAFESLFPFGSTDPDVNPNTVARLQRKNNRDLLRGVIRTAAVSYAYLNASEVTFATTDDLSDVQETLEAAYSDIWGDSSISDQTREQLDRLRVQAEKVLESARVSAQTLITVQTRRIPLSVLVYSYYGSTELVDQIADLNNIKQNAFVEGDVVIVAL